MNRVVDAIRRRPHRVVELVVSLLGLAAAFGFDLDPEQRNAILGLLATLIVGSETAQTRTTSLARPRAGDGRPLAPVNGAPAERGAD